MARLHIAGSRAPIAVSAAAVIVTVAVAPFGRQQLSPTVSFVPALLAVVACFDLLSVYLLMSEYRDNGDPRMLAMCGAYVWSLVLMTGYALAFPGVFSPHPPLAFTPSTAPWLYVGWHAGFPILLGAAWAPWPKQVGDVTLADSRRRIGWTLMTLVVLLAASVVTLGAAFAHQLPVLIHGRDTTRMTQLTAPVVVPLVVLAVIAAWRGTRRRTGPERWTAVAVLVCLCDLVLTYSSRYRYSVGWYSGRAMTLTAAAVVLLAMLVEFRRLKRRAEFNAAYDSLTGLANHRSTHDMLGHLFAVARRSTAPLGVVIVDLDFFKLVNDTYGHAAGDRLLGDVGAALAGAVRAGDLVGRVGGEEFLALLPDTHPRGALVVAERMRLAVAAIPSVTGGAAPTASLGVACMIADDHTSADLIRRADEALYRAKAAGRNRVVMAGVNPAVEQIAVQGRVIAQREWSNLSSSQETTT